MLNALKQLIGLAPHDNQERWLGVPVIVVDSSGQEIFAGECDVVYLPSPESYEHGSATIYDSSTGVEIMTFNVLHAEKSIGAPTPMYWARYQATGAIMDAVDTTGREVTILVRRPADTYILNSENLLDIPPVTPTILIQPGEEVVEEEVMDEPPVGEEPY